MTDLVCWGWGVNFALSYLQAFKTYMTQASDF